MQTRKTRPAEGSDLPRCKPGQAPPFALSGGPAGVYESIYECLPWVARGRDLVSPGEGPPSYRWGGGSVCPGAVAWVLPLNRTRVSNCGCS